MKKEEDKDIRDLFDGFHPELPSDDDFMTRLGESLDRMEIVKEFNDCRVRRSRMATFCALVVGFVCGMAATLAWPYVSVWMAEANLSWLNFKISLNGMKMNPDIMCYSILSAGLTAVLMLRSYRMIMISSLYDSED